ncbi:alpha/beta-hydrolase [Hortaea werneckii]|nr:alpha/beta-hydrolase [Hortaea werneckii]
MTSFTIEEGFLSLPDKPSEVYTRTTRPSKSIQAKARLVFIHDFSDHSNAQDDLFIPLAEKGIIVYSFDQRGWGQSVKKAADKGKTGTTDQVMIDITYFVKNHVPARQEKARLTVFIMGHSMGGQETFTYATIGPKDVVGRIRSFLAEAPWIAPHPSTQPWELTGVLGRMARKLMPLYHMVNELDSNLLSRDLDVNDGYVKNPLCHNTGTLVGLAGMLDRALALNEHKNLVPEGVGEGGKTRLWLGHGTGDAICDFLPAKRYFENLKIADKQMMTYEGWHHKLHAEPGQDKIKFAEDVSKWKVDRSGQLHQADAAAASRRSRQ